MTDEREDLDALINSAGWQRFAKMVAEQWGSTEGGGVRFVTQMTAVAKSDDATALPMMRQIIAAQRELQAVLRWPEERLAILKRTEVMPDSDAAPLTQSRRGGL